MPYGSWLLRVRAVEWLVGTISEPDRLNEKEVQINGEVSVAVGGRPDKNTGGR